MTSLADGVAVVPFEPEAPDPVGALLARLTVLEADTDIRAAIIVFGATGPAAPDTTPGLRQRQLLDFADLRLPLVAAVDAVVTRHGELALLCDLLVMADGATLADDRLASGEPPVDGAHVAWLLAVGPLQARLHLLTGKPLTAREALARGAASDVPTTGTALDRALEIAAQIASRSRQTGGYAREALAQERRRRLVEEAPLGIALAAAAASAPAPSGEPRVYRPDAYDQVRLERDADGIVTLTMHDGAGGPWRFRSSTFRDIHLACAEVIADPAAKALIITGAGDAFCPDGDLAEVPPVLLHLTPESFDYFHRNGGRTFSRQFDLELPVVLALNGPARIHTEFFYGADIVLAADHATIADTNHLPVGYAIGASGIAWEDLAGPSRARRLVFGFEEVGAADALASGLVSEIVPADRLAARARELALQLARLPHGTARALRVALGASQRRAYAIDYRPGAAMLSLSLLGATTPASESDPFRQPGLRSPA